MKCPDCGGALSSIDLAKHPFQDCIDNLKVKLAVLQQLGKPLVEYMEILGNSPRGAVLLWHVDSKNGDTVVTAQELKALADALKETSR